MAVSQDDLQFHIDVDSIDAIKNIKTFGDAFGGLGLQILQANAAVELGMRAFEGLKVVFEAILEPFKEAIHASIEYNATLGKLGNTLKLTGEYSQNSLDAFKEFANTMEQNTTQSQEQTFTMLAMAKAIGISDDAAMELVQTAKNLSSVTGKDVDTSFHALLGSLKGTARELALLDPTIKDFSQSQLRSGAAVDQLAKKYDGFAVSAAKSYKGVIQQAENFKKEIFRNVGDVLAVAFDVKGTEEFKLALYKNILETIESIKPSLLAFAEGVRDIKKALVGGIIDLAKNFGDVIVRLYHAFAAVDFQVIAISIGVLTTAFGALFVTMKAEVVLTFIANIETLIAILRTFAVAAYASVAPVLVLAGQFIAIVAAIVAVSAAVDFLVKNGLNLLVGTLNYVCDAFLKATGYVMKFFGAVDAGNKMIANGDKLGDKASGLLGNLKMGDATKEVLDTFTKMRDGFNQTTEAAGHATVAAKTIQGAFGRQKPVVDKAAMEEYKKQLDEIHKTTDQLNLDAEKSSMTQLEYLDKQLEAIQKVITAKKEEIDLNTKYSPAQKTSLKSALDEEFDAATNKNDAEKAQAPGQEYDEVQVATKKSIQGLSQAFQSGTAGMVLGLAGAAGQFVDVLQGIVDFIPGLLDKIANLFNSITDLPNKLVSGVGNVLKSVLSFVSSFIPNVLKAIPTILRMIVQFLVTGLPEAFKALFAAIPELVVALIDAIPEVIGGLVQDFIASMPLIIVSFVENIIPQLPRIALALVKAIAVDLPKAVVKGIIDGVKSVFSALGGLFKGGSIVDTTEITKQFNSIKKLTGQMSTLFNVKDLTTGIADVATTQAKELAQSIEDGMQRGINALIEAWRWIYNNIIGPIVEAFTRVFAWVKGLFDQIVASFNSAWSFLKGIWDGIAGIFNSFLSGFNQLVTPFKEAVHAFENAIQPLRDVVNKLTSWKPPSIGGGGGGGEGWIAEAGHAIGLARGGPVYASSGMLMTPRGSDVIPAMLAPGEFVMSAGASKSLGLGALTAMNSGAKMTAGSIVNNNEFTINISAKSAVDESFVRQKLMVIIKEELRRASLDGERLLSVGGIR